MSVLDDIFGTQIDKENAPELILLKDIKRDGGTQMRAGLDQPTVKEYADAMVSFGPRALPPLIVFYDGSNYWLADGFHRYAALEQVVGANGPVWCDVRAGTQRDAMLHAAGANASHGLRRTNSDKRRAVLALLQDPEWAQWSDGEIAKRCAVSQPFVSGLRKDFAPERNVTIVRLPDAPADWDEDTPTHNGYESTPVVRKGADGRAINTANIGKSPKAAPVYAQIYELESVIREIVGKATAQDVRNAARNGVGSWFYAFVKGVLDGRIDWRKSDLVQALNNVAAQMEAKANGTNSPNLGTSSAYQPGVPGLPPTPGLNTEMAQRIRYLTDVEEIVMGWHRAGTYDVFNHAEPYMIDFIIEACAQRNFTISRHMAGQALINARNILVFEAKEQAKADAREQAKQAKRNANTPPVSLENGKNLIDWTDADWDEAQAKLETTPEVAARNTKRREDAFELLHMYHFVVSSEKQYSELTGDFVGTIPVIEGLRKMIAGLESLIEALQ